MKNGWNAKLFISSSTHSGLPTQVARQPHGSSSLNFSLLMHLSLLCFYVVYPVDYGFVNLTDAFG